MCTGTLSRCCRQSKDVSHGTFRMQAFELLWLLELQWLLTALVTCFPNNSMPGCIQISSYPWMHECGPICFVWDVRPVRKMHLKFYRQRRPPNHELNFQLSNSRIDLNFHMQPSINVAGVKQNHVATTMLHASVCMYVQRKRCVSVHCSINLH